MAEPHRHLPNVLNGLRFDSDIYTTEIYTGGHTTVVSCTEAWSPLQSLLETQGESVQSQQRFGTTAQIGAAEAGLRIANNPAAFAALEKSLDRVGLRSSKKRPHD